MGRARALACVPVVLLLGGLGLLAAGCGGSGNAAQGATTSTQSTTTAASTPLARPAAFRAFQSCLRAHGIDLHLPRLRPPARPPGAPRRGRSGLFLLGRLTQAQRLAFRTCRGKLPKGAGGRFRGGGPGRLRGAGSPAFARYTRCLAQHGVRFGTRQDPSAFRKAQTACRALLPSAG